MIRVLVVLKHFIENKKNRIRTMMFRKYCNIHSVSIISSDCIGGLIYHDTQNKFLTPTINMSFDPLEFCKMLKNAENIKSAFLTEKRDSKIPAGTLHFPDGKCDFVFNHYESYNDGFNKWVERVGRITENIFVIVNSRVLTNELLSAFSEIPYRKILFCEETNVEIHRNEDIFISKYNAVKYKNILSLKRGYNLHHFNIFKKIFAL